MFLRGAAFLIMVAALGGCDLGRPSGLSAQITTRQEALDPPQLWRAEQLASGGVPVAAVHVCAAEVHRAAFLRPGLEVNGRPCANFGPAVDTPRLHQTRCRADGREFQVRIDSSGDPATAFITTLAIRPLDALSPPMLVTRRYTKIGPCPKGWPVGRQARTALPELG